MLTFARHASRHIGRSNMIKKAMPMANVHLLGNMQQMRLFAAKPAGDGFNIQGLASAMSLQASTSSKMGKRAVNTKMLCDLIGSRYYPTNEEIELDDEKIVQCFDENDQKLGEMTLRESRIAA